jgi:hypothetical protein
MIAKIEGRAKRLLGSVVPRPDRIWLATRTPEIRRTV